MAGESIPAGAPQAVENGDATLLARTPFHDHLYATYPQATLSASGMDVGLPRGADGQLRSRPPQSRRRAGSFIRISRGSTRRSPTASSRRTRCCRRRSRRRAGRRLHFSGSCRMAACTSHQDHLVALCQSRAGGGRGRHHGPRDHRRARHLADGRRGLSGARWSAGWRRRGAKIATVIGRYFAMDRDQRWERNKLAWDAIVLGRGDVVAATSPSAAVSAAYDDGAARRRVSPADHLLPRQRAARPRWRRGAVVQFPRRPRAAAFDALSLTGFRRLRPRGSARRCTTSRSRNTTRPTRAGGLSRRSRSRRSSAKWSAARGCSSCASRRRRNIRTSLSSSTAA